MNCFAVSKETYSVIILQASVILLISLIMLIEYRDRGAFFMWPNARSSDKFSKAVRLNPKPINLVRKLVIFKKTLLAYLLLLFLSSINFT